MKIWKYFFGVLVLIILLIWIVFLELPDDSLHIIVCDVGQGDAILITYKTIQILTDGGPDEKVLRCLSRYVPFWDRQIELVVSTHPDSDHATGLVSVIQRYNIQKILINNLKPITQTAQALRNEVGREGVKVLFPYGGLRLGSNLIYLDVVHPDLDFKNRETNNYSIVYKLVFGKFKAIFTGDLGSDISDLITQHEEIESVDYIKVNHHGSLNGLTNNLLKELMPKVAVISVGKNSYGHPRGEIINMLVNQGVKVFRTDKKGDVELITDGKSYQIKGEK